MLAVIGMAFGVAQAASQAVPPPLPPPTEIFLASLSESGGRLAIGVPTNISRNEGYDNQPHFTPAGDAVLFTSMRDGRQTDIYRYDLRGGVLTQMTNTPESEYSPTVVPDRDGYSVVRVEADGTQRLWKIPFAPESPRPILPDVKPVGYHAWADSDTLVLFVLGEPPTLRLASARTGTAEILAREPGRSLVPVANQRVTFVQKAGEKGPWKIVQLDTRTRRMTPIAETIRGREDYAILGDGRILMASGSKISVFDGTSWQEIADMAPSGLTDITRLAVSPDGRRVALVAELKN
jgi:hypothetical protein